MEYLDAMREMKMFSEKTSALYISFTQTRAKNSPYLKTQLEKFEKNGTLFCIENDAKIYIMPSGGIGFFLRREDRLFPTEGSKRDFSTH